MIKMTAEEVKDHHAKIKQIRSRVNRANEKYAEGDITKKKWEKIRKEVKEEEAEYVKTSGVILYFGNYFRGSK